MGFECEAENGYLRIMRDKCRYHLVIDEENPVYGVLILPGIAKVATIEDARLSCDHVTKSIPLVKALINGEYVNLSAEFYLTLPEQLTALLPSLFQSIDAAVREYNDVLQKISHSSTRKIQAQLAAAAGSISAVGTASKTIDGFAAWFLAGFGAGLVVLLSNLGELSSVIQRANVITAAQYFVYAAICCACQRYISAVVVSGAVSAKSGEEIARNYPDLDAEAFKSAFLNTYPFVLRAAVRGAFKAIDRGDFGYSSRLFIRLTLYQGLLITAEMVLLLRGVSMIVSSIAEK